MGKISLICSIFFVLTIVTTSCKDNTSSNSSNENIESSEKRIVSLNASITEILAELGINGELVGRDATSVYPLWVKDSVKNFGPPWTVSAEALLSIKPDLVFAVNTDFDLEKSKTLEKSGVEVVILDKIISLEDAKKTIIHVAEYTNSHDYERVFDKIDSDLAKVEPFAQKPKVLFVYARGTGLMQVAGRETPMAELIELAGAENATNDFEDMKPLTPEGLVKSNPDVILMFESGINSLGGNEGLFEVPGMKETNAFKNKAVVTMDSSLLSSMGPRIGEAAYLLNQLLKPYAE